MGNRMVSIRTLAIWGTGILASAFAGLLLGHAVGRTDTDFSGGLSLLAGPLAFICFRLWMIEKTR